MRGTVVRSRARSVSRVFRLECWFSWWPTANDEKAGAVKGRRERVFFFLENPCGVLLSIYVLVLSLPSLPCYLPLLWRGKATFCAQKRNQRDEKADRIKWYRGGSTRPPNLLLSLSPGSRAFLSTLDGAADHQASTKGLLHESPASAEPWTKEGASWGGGGGGGAGEGGEGEAAQPLPRARAMASLCLAKVRPFCFSFRFFLPWSAVDCS